MKKKNYEVFVGGKSTGKMIVNSPSEEDAKRVWYQFENNESPIVLKSIRIDVLSMFSNCIMAAPKRKWYQKLF